MCDYECVHWLCRVDDRIRFLLKLLKRWWIVAVHFTIWIYIFSCFIVFNKDARARVNSAALSCFSSFMFSVVFPNYENWRLPMWVCGTRCEPVGMQFGYSRRTHIQSACVAFHCIVRFTSSSFFTQKQRIKINLDMWNVKCECDESRVECGLQWIFQMMRNSFDINRECSSVSMPIFVDPSTRPQRHKEWGAIRRLINC